MKHNNYVAIMAGGIGSRFWPVSRNKLPKQFLDFLGTGRSLIQSTFDRFQDLAPKENIYIITFQEYEELVARQLPEIPRKNIIVEPSRKNTAPTAALASYKIYSENPEARIILTPADHLIMDTQEFRRIAEKALDFVSNNDSIVTLGIKPHRPDTGYGYIQYATDKEVEPDVYKVVTFTEKPSLEIAKSFLKSGDFLWNSGLFFFKASHFIEEFNKYQSEMAEVFEARKDDFGTENEQSAIDEIYPQCINISIDYGVIEHSQNVNVIPSDFGWTDLGTWESVHQKGEKDYLGNVVFGDNVMIMDANNCLVKVPKEKLVLLQGLEDFIIVDTEDVLLICERSKEQEIKSYIQEVKKSKGDKFL